MKLKLLLLLSVVGLTVSGVFAAEPEALTVDQIVQ